MSEVVVALLTPYRPDGSPDLAALGRHVELLVEAGVDALMPCGTTGEGPLLDQEETMRLVDATVRYTDGRVRVLAHVGRPSTAETVRLARWALADGVSAVSAVVPYYYAYSEEQLLGHFRALIEAAAGKPAYAYTIPARAGNDLSADAVRALVADGLAGVKDSTKSWERHVEFLACGCDVLIGTDALVYEAFRAGAAGCVSALANVRPDLLCALRDGEHAPDP